MKCRREYEGASRKLRYCALQMWLITCAVWGSGLLTSYMNSMVWVDRPEVVQVCFACCTKYMTCEQFCSYNMTSKRS
jgi:hypothetical protein